jgi:hypothetical protein
LFEEAGFSPKSFAYLESFLARKSADEFILEKKFDSSVVSVICLNYQLTKGLCQAIKSEHF